MKEAPVSVPRVLNPSERIINKSLELLETLIDGLKSKPLRTIVKLVVLSWFSRVALAFIVLMAILFLYALYSNSDAYRFNQAKKFLMRKYGKEWTKHLNELRPFDYVA